MVGGSRAGAVASLLQQSAEMDRGLRSLLRIARVNCVPVAALCACEVVVLLQHEAKIERSRGGELEMPRVDHALVGRLCV